MEIHRFIDVSSLSSVFPTNASTTRTSLVTIDRSVVKDESREKLNSNRRYEYFARALCKNRIVRANIHHDFTIYKRRKHRNETVLLSRDDPLRKKSWIERDLSHRREGFRETKLLLLREIDAWMFPATKTTAEIYYSPRLNLDRVVSRLRICPFVRS